MSRAWQMMIGVLLTLAGLAACVGPLDQLDREVDRMIERRQELALDASGQVGTVAARPEELARQTSGIYDTNPETLSPGVDQLPAKRRANDASPSDVDPEAIADQAEPLELDLEKLLAYAIEHSPEYRNQKEALFLSTLSLIVERHLWGPRFFSTLTGQVSGTPEAGDFDQVAEIVGDLRATQRLPYGGEVSIGALVQYTRILQEDVQTTGGETTDDDFASISLTGSFELPLLRGAGQSARESLIQAERNLIYEVRAFEQFRREFFVDLASDYFDLIVRELQIENREQQVASLTRLRDRFVALAEAGRERYFEAEQSESNVLSAQAQLNSDYDSYQAALDALKLRIGLPVDQAMMIVPVEVQVPLPILDPRAATKTGLAYRLDLQTQRDRVDDAIRSVQVAKNDLLPGLNAFGDIRIPTRGDTFDDGVELDPGQGQYNAGLRFDAPIDRKIEYANYRRALIDLERSRRATAVLEDRVALEVRNAIRQIEQSRINLDLQDRNVEINQRRLISVQLRERSLGPRDVIEAQEDLADAQDARDAAARDLRLSVLRFLLNTGQMRVGADGGWLPPTQLVPLPPIDKQDAPPGIEAADIDQPSGTTQKAG